MVNDISLSNNGDGTFDWRFGANGVVDATGVERIRSAVIHNALLKDNELEMVSYIGARSALSGFEKRAGDDTGGLVLEALESMVRGVDGVADARVVLGDDTGIVSINGIFVTLENGVEVRIL